MAQSREHVEQHLQSVWQRWQNGDRKAVGELYTYYAPRLRASAFLYLKDEELAKDIVQELFINIMNKRHHIKENVGAYLMRAVSNRCLSNIQTTTRRAEIAQGINDTKTTVESSIDDIDRPNVRACINQLSDEKQRQVLLMDLEEYEEEAIAREIGETVKRVRKIRYQARQHLKKNPLLKEII